MTMASSPPGSLRVLEQRIGEHARASGQTAGALRITIGQVVVCQLLPACVVKGGSGVKFRLGGKFTRDSKDLDTSLRSDRELFAKQLGANLAEGWLPFTGQLQPQAQRPIVGVPSSYLMSPYKVKLNVYNKPFATVTLEVGYDELAAIEEGEPEFVLADDIKDLFAVCGLPTPNPVPVLATHHQVAQKIHACTEPGSERAHDLVDLQLLWPASDKQLRLTAATTRRLFSYRRAHAFPGTCEPTSHWPTAYADAAEGLDVVPTSAEAVKWLNDRLATFSQFID